MFEKIEELSGSRNLADKIHRVERTPMKKKRKKDISGKMTPISLRKKTSSTSCCTQDGRVLDSGVGASIKMMDSLRLGQVSANSKFGKLPGKLSGKLVTAVGDNRGLVEDASPPQQYQVRSCKLSSKIACQQGQAESCYVSVQNVHTVQKCKKDSNWCTPGQIDNIREGQPITAGVPQAGPGQGRGWMGTAAALQTHLASNIQSEQGNS